MWIQSSFDCRSEKVSKVHYLGTGMKEEKGEEGVECSDARTHVTATK